MESAAVVGANGSKAGGNGTAPAGVLPTRSRRRATAQSMADSQRDISVSEFFAKNRHLLGFDNPRKALLTTVKEAVDNALDACEEAGILPEIWVHIQRVGPDRYKVGVQDNGPGILKKQIPLIFGKLLYGSKFHRLRMSRGQQGIGISAAGMHGLLTTGKPVKIMSKVSKRDPAHYYEIQIDTKRNLPEILNGRGEGVEIPPNGLGDKLIEKHGIEWIDLDHGTRVTIELEAKYQRGRGSVDEYLEQTAIANPHVAIHYTDPDDNKRDYVRVAEQLPAEPKEIKPHPYGVELGRLVTMLQQTKAPTIAQFLGHSFSRVSSNVARRLCAAAKIGTRASPRKIGRHEADLLYQAIQHTKIPAPATDCIAPIGEPLILKGLRQVVPGEFYAAATRPPAVYRGNPFQIEVGLAYGGTSPVSRVTRDATGRTSRRKRRPHTSPIPHYNFSGPWRRGRRQDSRRSQSRYPRLAGPTQIGRRRATPSGPAERQHQRGPVDERAALRQSRAAAISGRRLRHYANRDVDQLAGLRAQPVARFAAQRANHRDDPHGQRVGPVHQRIEGGHRLVSRDSKRVAAGPASRRPQIGHVFAEAAAGAARRPAPQPIPALRGRGGHRRQPRQRRRIAKSSTISYSKWPKNAPPRPTSNSTTAASRSKRTRKILGRMLSSWDRGTRDGGRAAMQFSRCVHAARFQRLARRACGR